MVLQAAAPVDVVEDVAPDAAAPKPARLHAAQALETPKSVTAESVRAQTWCPSRVRQSQCRQGCSVGKMTTGVGDLWGFANCVRSPPRSAPLPRRKPSKPQALELQRQLQLLLLRRRCWLRRLL